MRNIRLLAFVAAYGLTASAIAAVAIPSGWYLEGNVGKSKESGKSYGTGFNDSSSGAGGSVFGGFKFIPYFAAEVGYTYYADTTIKSGGNKVATDKHYSYDIAAKAILPVYDSGFDLFAKLGIANVHSSVTKTNSASSISTGSNNASSLYYGLGTDYSITPNIAVNLQWARAQGSNSTGTLDLYSVGLAYLFG